MPRQRRLVELLAKGLSSAEIARKMGIQPITVYTSTYRIKVLLGASSHPEIVARARALGIIADQGRALPFLRLSAQQKSVLRLARADVRPIDIAARLSLSPDVVYHMIEAIVNRYNARSTLHAIDILIEQGLLEGEAPKIARNLLTEREYKIIEGAYNGWSNREIGETLGVTRSNVGNRLAILKKKLDVADVDELLDEVVRRRLFVPNTRRKSRVSRHSIAIEAPKRAAAVLQNERELETLRVFAGAPRLSLQEVADRTGVARSTVARAVSGFKLRLGAARTRDEAIRKARALGIVSGHSAPLRRDEHGTTALQREALALVAKGLRVTAIAERLGHDKRSVHKELLGVVHRLGATSRLDAILIARKRGIIR